LYTPIDVSALIYYPFDDETGGTNLGSGGAAYNSPYGGSVRSTYKVVGTGGIGFGDYTYNSACFVPTFDTGSTGLSFAFWFQFSGSAALSRIIDFGSYYGRSNKIVFGLDHDNDVFVECTGAVAGASFEKKSLFGLNVNDGKWRHVAWTIDTSGNWLIYLNGALQKTYYSVYYPNSVTLTSNYLGTSGCGWWIDNWVVGAVDEFYMLQSVLSRAQVQELYNQG